MFVIDWLNIDISFLNYFHYWVSAMFLYVLEMIWTRNEDSTAYVYSDEAVRKHTHTHIKHTHTHTQRMCIAMKRYVHTHEHHYRMCSLQNVSSIAMKWYEHTHTHHTHASHTQHKHNSSANSASLQPSPSPSLPPALRACAHLRNCDKQICNSRA